MKCQWGDQSVTESEFNEQVDATFAALEQALDATDSDLDYENSGGVLTVEFENDTTMVFSRQPATLQLWLATRSGGYHFVYDATATDWRNTRTDALFRPFVVEEISAQAGLALVWE